jgi:hypothetical protein
VIGAATMAAIAGARDGRSDQTIREPDLTPLSSTTQTTRSRKKLCVAVNMVLNSRDTGSIGPSPAHAAAVFTESLTSNITGTAVEGNTLSETHGVRSTQPTKDADAWQRCDKSGNDCESIPKATMQTYRLTAKDVGFTIRVGESASNAAGAVTPSASDPTAVVQAKATGGHGGGSGGYGAQAVSAASHPSQQ